MNLRDVARLQAFARKCALFYAGVWLACEGLLTGETHE